MNQKQKRNKEVKKSKITLEELVQLEGVSYIDYEGEEVFVGTPCWQEIKDTEVEL